MTYLSLIIQARPVRMYLPKMTLAASALMGLLSVSQAQSLTDLGANAPTPGSNDVNQLSLAGNQTAPDGLKLLH